MWPLIRQLSSQDRDWWPGTPKGQIIVFRLVVHENISSAFAAEALAGLEAKKMGLDLGFQIVTIEEVSLTVIKKCSTDLPDASEISVYIRDIKRYRSRFQALQFKHANRQENKVAYALAIEVLKPEMRLT